LYGAAPREARRLSKIIKKSETAQNPAALDDFRLPVLEKKKPGKENRSLKFSETVQKEIDDWQKRYSEYLASQRSIQSHALEKAYREGYEKGFSEGQDQEKSDRIAVIDTLLKEAKLRKEQAIRNLEIKVVELAMNVAERIIHRSISADGSIMDDIIREVLSNIIGSETVVMKVSEHDLNLVNAKHDQWLNLSGNVREFRIEVDKRLKSGDCIIETESGINDAMISSRLDVLAEKLLSSDR
jgi:flagellar assembly protein FliH